MRRPRPLFFALALALAPGAALAQDGAAAADSAWQAGDMRRARALYAELLARDSTDARARHRLALLLARDREFRGSLQLLERLIADAPENRGAAMSRAGVLAMSGDLVGAEARWREVLAHDTADQVAIAGLAQTLRLQGRDAAARELLIQAKPPLPDEVEIAQEMAWNRAALKPRIAPALTYERDTGGNHIIGFDAAARWHPFHRLRLYADGFTRAAHGPGETEARARGATLGVWHQREPGWELSAALGVHGSDVPAADPFPAAVLAVASPPRHRAGGAFTLSAGALDGTVAVIESQVRLAELSLDGWWRGAHWRLDASGALAALHGRVSDRDNTRVAGSATLTRTLSDVVTAGATARAFGYDADLDDGYFDPDSYLLLELVARYHRDFGGWIVDLEGAPGVERIEAEPLTGSWRTAATLAWSFAPGRELGLTLAWSGSRAHALSDAAAGGGYRYFAARLGGSWSF